MAQLFVGQSKSRSGRRIALDTATVAVLTAHLADRQQRLRAQATD